MVSTAWVQKRTPHWDRLERLIGAARGGLGALSHHELQELGLLYRQTASDLAAVNEDASSAQLAAYLNQLLARSHNLIYLGQRPRASGIIRFYRDIYPAAFRETLPATLAALLVFLAGGFIGCIVTLSDPGFAHRLLGPQMTETIERHQMWTHSVVAVKPLAASAITTNNLTVAAIAFASGITVIGTVWTMLFNGLLLGVVGTATARAGMAVALWSFVVPHGALELPAIIIAGGSGFEIARGLLFPGLLPRRESLSRAGVRASRLFLGTIPMLLIAGTIEGFFSPGDAPNAMKFALGAALFGALLAYLFGIGRRTTTADGAPSSR